MSRVARGGAALRFRALGAAFASSSVLASFIAFPHITTLFGWVKGSVAQQMISRYLREPKYCRFRVVGWSGYDFVREKRASTESEEMDDGGHWSRKGSRFQIRRIQNSRCGATNGEVVDV
ncbi:uncharacterized protein IWZ02DRAFT_263573 [Phyllosticta citriasiana]|uniref:uncharacterized protein n=1 Tax=Phyllosticta citriasiana TaxID=595635 RepID=UPI0030FD93B5